MTKRLRTDAAEVVLYEAAIEPVRVHGALTHIEGRAVPYGIWTNRGVFEESVAAGCFDKSVREAASALPLLLFHDDEQFPIGISEQWESRPDGKDSGLFGVWRMAEDDRAQRAAELAADGMLNYFSVGHTPVRSEWDFVDPKLWDPAMGPGYIDKVTRIEGRLVETSLVSTPAFAEAQVRLVRSAYSRETGKRPRVEAARAYLAEHRDYAGS